MGTAITVIIVLVVIVIIIALIAMGSYNGFVRSRNLIQESWRQIDVELNRRYELIPNLVETVRAYAAHERNTLEDITRLRSQAQSVAQSDGALPSQQRADVEQALSGAVRNLIVSVEAYPDLKSNQNFLELQRQLAETEDRIAAGPAVLQRQRARLQHQGRVGAVQRHRRHVPLREGHLLRGQRPLGAPGARRQLRGDRLPRAISRAARGRSRRSSRRRRSPPGATTPCRTPSSYSQPPLLPAAAAGWPATPRRRRAASSSPERAG